MLALASSVATLTPVAARQDRNSAIMGGLLK
jgi:hypothetical protein